MFGGQLEAEIEDFGFKETDTICIIERMIYKQNQKITFNRHFERASTIELSSPLPKKERNLLQESNFNQ